MGSTRLPGKVLKELAGKTVLYHVISRCLAIRNADIVCCAVPIGVDNDPVAEEANSCGAVVFRGSELDVLDRYYQAANYLKSDYILRVTSDCPLIDPNICEKVIELLKSKACRFATNNLTRSWPHGLDCEAFDFQLLCEAAEQANNPSQREHVTGWMRENLQDVNIKNYVSPNHTLAKNRWTLDTQDDYQFLRRLFDLMSPEVGFSYKVPIGILRDNPLLLNLNAK